MNYYELAETTYTTTAICIGAVVGTLIGLLAVVGGIV